MNNQIYKTIYSVEKGQFVVVSELAKGRGKTKSKAAKVILSSVAVLLASFSMLTTSLHAAAPDCDANVCTLDPTWSYLTANKGAGTLFVNNGQTYDVYGPDIMRSGTIAPTREKISLISGWTHNWVTGTGIAAGVDPATLGTISFSTAGAENVQVTNPSGITETITLYNPNNLSLSSTADREIITILDPNITDLQFYYDAGFVTVTDGEAQVYLKTLDTITTGLSRNTAFALADSTNGGQAKVVWNSDVIYAPTILPDNYDSAGKTGSQDVVSHDFVGAFTAFDSSSWNITNLAEYQVYLAYLNQQVKDGNIHSLADYNAYRSAPYSQKTYSYDYNIPSGAGVAELYDPKTGDALLMAKGNNATVEVAAGVTLTQQRGPSSSAGSQDFPDNDTVPYGMILMTEGGKGINYGTLRAHGGYSLVSAQGVGSSFTNADTGIIEIGCDSLTADCGKNRTQTISARDGGEFINNGQIVHYGANSATSDQSSIFYIYHQGKVINNGEVYISAAEK